VAVLTVLSAVSSKSTFGQTRAHPQPVLSSAAGAPVDDTAVARAAKLREEGNTAMVSMRYADALSAYRSAASDTFAIKTHASVQGRVWSLERCSVAWNATGFAARYGPEKHSRLFLG
jgi:hypothetical protein